LSIARPDFDDEDNEKEGRVRSTRGASIVGMRERERKRGTDSFAAVSEQFKDTARTSSTRIKVAGTGSGARGDTSRRYTLACILGPRREPLFEIDPGDRIDFIVHPSLPFTSTAIFQYAGVRTYKGRSLNLSLRLS
jgi:hypothetical protein